MVGHGVNSTTSATCAESGNWLGNGPNITVIDTPGFGDTRNNFNFDVEQEQVEEMVDYLKENAKDITVFLICLKGDNMRVDNG